MKAQAMVWSVRRELWENRSLYIAPFAVAAIVTFGSLVATLVGLLRGVVVHSDKLAQPYNLAALLLMGTTFLIAIFYCLEALHGERRDRSVLFWKSMPVSDLATVLSKAAIPLAVLPVLTFAITIATQFIMLLLSSAVLVMTGHSAAPLWTQLPWGSMSLMLLYHLVTVHSLYYAPIFGWLLLISAWSRRAPFLWAFLPPAAIGFVEKMAFNTSHFAKMLASRISGGMDSNSAPDGMMLGHFHPIDFLTKPGLWIGLAIAAAFLAGAVRLRRYRGPI
jgi:ABC-2 type transport system permease protein